MLSSKYVYCLDIRRLWYSIEFYSCRVIRISPFANRLSFDAPPVVQRLRCLANYQALRFSSPILSIGETLVERMRKHSAINGGKYVSVHLRFEEVCFDQIWMLLIMKVDMLAFVATDAHSLPWAGYGCFLLLCFRWWKTGERRHDCG